MIVALEHGLQVEMLPGLCSGVASVNSINMKMFIYMIHQVYILGVQFSHKRNIKVNYAYLRSPKAIKCLAWNYVNMSLQGSENVRTGVKC